MKKSLCALSGLALAAAAAAHTTSVPEGTAVVRIDVQSHEHLAQLEAAGANPLACRVGLGEQYFAADALTAETLEKAGAVIVERDLQSVFDAQQEHVRGGGFFSNYQPFDVIDAKLDEFALDERVDIVTIGDTLEGRTVRGVRIRGANAGPSTLRPAILVNGAQHAREWITPAACMHLADRLISDYGSDPQVTTVLDNVDFYIVPVVNADGYAYSFTPGNRLWRKNRRPNGGGSFGVDPNRNWAEGWGMSSGSSGSSFSQTYRGPAPFSEPCTANLRDFIVATPAIRGHIDVHNFAQLVLGAWAYTNTPAPREETLLPMGEIQSDAIEATNGTTFDARTGDGGIGFASGCMPDWTFGELGVMSWTYELRDQGQFGFQLPASQLVPASEESTAGILRFAEQIARCPSDLNLDGVVNSTDLAIILSRWSSARGLADADVDGTVGSGDLAAMLAAWGSVCPL